MTSIATDRRATVSVSVGESEISFETGKLAKQADGAVVVRSGDTMVLATAQGRAEAREGADFFPLTVDVEERAYAAGKIPGGFFKREGRATERATLTARMIDRPIRPLWPKGFRNEVQVICTVLSADMVTPHDILAINGASAALMISACAIANASSIRSSGSSSAPASIIVSASRVPTTIRSSDVGPSFMSGIDGLTTNWSLIRPTRTAPTGP